MNDRELMRLIDNSMDTAVTVVDVGREVRLVADQVARALWLLESLSDILHLVDDYRMDDTKADVLVGTVRLQQARDALDAAGARLPAKSPMKG